MSPSASTLEEAGGTSPSRRRDPGCMLTPVRGHAHRGTPPIGLALEPGELVRFRERRAPPVLMLVVVPAAIVVTLAATDVPLAVRAVSALAVAALAVLGLRLRRRVWLEDLVVTDRRVGVVPRDGDSSWLRLDELAGARERGTAVRFTALDGRILSFAYVRSTRSLRRRLGEVRPDLAVAIEYDPHCPTCGIRW